MVSIAQNLVVERDEAEAMVALSEAMEANMVAQATAMDTDMMALATAMDVDMVALATAMDTDMVATVDMEDISEILDTVQVTDSVVALALETTEAVWAPSCLIFFRLSTVI